MLSSSALLAADGTYVFDKVSARTDDGSEVRLKLHVGVDDNALPEYWHWRLEKEPVEKVVRLVSAKHTMEDMMGHRAKIAAELKAALADELKASKVIVEEVKIIDMEFTMRGDN